MRWGSVNVAARCCMEKGKGNQAGSVLVALVTRVTAMLSAGTQKSSLITGS